MEKSVFKSTNAMVLASLGIVLNIVAGMVVCRFTIYNDQLISN